ncbi:MAG: aldo/keto reductase [Terrimesophilobacter sp.]
MRGVPVSDGVGHAVSVGSPAAAATGAEHCLSSRLPTGTAETTHHASNVILGLMRIAVLDNEDIRALVGTARQTGINYFDHADVYGNEPHECEKRFGEAISFTPAEQESVIIQSNRGRQHSRWFQAARARQGKDCGISSTLSFTGWPRGWRVVARRRRVDVPGSQRPRLAGRRQSCR